MKEVGNIDWRRFERFLIAEGCVFKGKVGSHNKYKKIGLTRPIIVPRYKSLPDFIISNNLRTLGVSKEYFIERVRKL